MTRLIDAAFANTRVVMTALAVMTFFGIIAFATIPREADPDIPVPVILVTMPLPGISPEDGERLLVKPTELELQSIDGLKQMDSVSYDGAAQIVLEFETTIDVDQAAIEVREAVDRAKSKYPTTAEEPIVTEFNLQNESPILSIILHGSAPERAMYQAARKLKDRLESVPGVLEARLTGAREELLEVIVDPRTLETYGLTELEVVSAVTANNRLVTAGTLNLDDGRFSVKAPGLVKNAPDLLAIPVRADGDRVVTIADVATVRRKFVDRTGHALFNGEPAIGVEITKRVGANIVETIEAAREVVEENAEFWPATVKYAYLNDQSVFVHDSLDGLTESVLTAIALVMILIVAALGLRSAIMVGIAIPTSFLIGFLLLQAFGFTLNMMVMFGLVLAVGLLVDGAIIIVEYADRRMSEGATRQTAYLEASKRMFWPVVTSTSTTLAAFVPFLFWKDIPGEFMKFIPITLIFVLSASVIVALVFLPVLGALMGLPRWFKRRLGIKGKTGGDTPVNDEDADPTTLKGPIGAYARFIAMVIHRPLLVLGVDAALLAVCFASFVIASPDLEFFIRSDTEEVNLLVRARGNLSDQQSIRIVNEVAARVSDHPAIEHIYVQTGPGLGRNGNYPPDTIGQIGLDLVYFTERDNSTVVSEALRARVDGVPGVQVEVRQREQGPPVGKDVQVELSSVDFDALLAAADKVRDFVNTTSLDANGLEVPAYMDPEDTLPLPGIEWSMEVDRALAASYGLSTAQAGAALQFLTSGLLIDKYRPDDAEDEIDIRVRYPEQYRTILGLDSLRVQTPKGSVPLSNFVTREAKPQVDRIVRRNGERIVEVSANGSTRVKGHEVSQDQAIAHMKSWLQSGALGDGVSWIMRGADEETASAAAFFQSAMLAAMFMIALILLLEFNNFYHAGLTLTAVVLAVFGVMLGIALTGQYLSVIMTGTGIVALAGIVVNNNIVLIDTFQHLRKEGLSVEDAVVRTAAQRIRPVVLTKATTIFGLLPMVFQVNFNFVTGEITRGTTTSDWWVLLSSAIVYGLVFSTTTTLVLTPVLLAAPKILGERWASRKARRLVPAAAEAPALAEPARRAAE